MFRLLLHLVLTAVMLLAIAALLPGIEIHNLTTALISAVVLGLVNTLIKPIVSFLTFPITLLTLGLFGWVINGLMLALVAWVVPGFEVHNFGFALLAALLLSLLTALFGHFADKPVDLG